MAHIICSVMCSRFVTASMFGILFSADCFWGLTSSLGALPPKSSPSPQPVGALVRAWTRSACHPVSRTIQRRRRVPSHPWTHQMNLKRRYMLTLSIILIPLAEPPACSLPHEECLVSEFSVGVRDSPFWGPTPQRHSHKVLRRLIGEFICALKHFMLKCTKGLWSLK